MTVTMYRLHTVQLAKYWTGFAKLPLVFHLVLEVITNFANLKIGTPEKITFFFAYSKYLDSQESIYIMLSQNLQLLLYLYFS